jgi:hypothetical protein
MYRTLVAGPAFLVMMGISATVFPQFYFSYNGLLLLQWQLGLYFPAWTPAWMLVTSLDASLDFCASLDRRVLYLDSTTSA